MFLKSRLTFLALVGAFFILPVAAHATALPFYGPIVPSLNATCAGNWGGLVQLMNNAVAFLVTIAITVVAPLSIAYAGFLFTVNAFNPSGLGKAKTLLLDTVIGIVIILSAWLLVNLFLTTLTPQGLSGWTASLFSGGNQPCMSFPIATPTGAVGANGTTTAPNVPLSATGSGACDPDVVQAGAAAGGYTLTNAQANTLACIARPESSCGANISNYAWGKGSTAYGAFQVLLQSNASCYENTACQQAAGVTGPLNCASGFSGGNPIAGSSVVQRCTQAAANVGCSASAAACVLKTQGFGAWTTDPHGTSAQASCISQYNNGALR